ncbi:Lead, cadmium, zinc and mercury transporting ATPase; Copper-translocating P-type ATPase [Microbacterium esteraromaticum]|uniref:Lead, cadmium, zinc and mercury transporting ATPase Copper-translocating P-type ATPase n=1 Tax=Microbacterium esteraromaticum TaxID=57043 RepID=A0A1R4ILQ1_9MICO|nr:heavy metal translocating P-type ATPase [Microbacterium esteraromaticum]SJN20649.1 Lead, cadmium, zinc and mercury transporting ATPase; Copper-translocating P-type ATPase [Microbacterium esteraromaticum]
MTDPHSSRVNASQTPPGEENARIAPPGEENARIGGSARAGTPPHGENSSDHEAHPAGQDHEHHDHGGHVAQFRRLFWINVLIAIPVVAFSPMFAMLLGYSVPDFPGAAWIAPVLGSIMYVWGGRPFLTGGVDELKARRPGMMLLIALAITVAFLASWGATLGILHHELEFWWELALLVVIMLLGHWIEMRSLAQTTSALDSLAALLPDEAERVEGDEVARVSPADLLVGDIVIVRPGGSIPADGVIVDGRADIDESMLTGESRAVSRTVGDRVTAGTVATDSGLRVEIDAIGDDTAIAGIRKLVSDAQASSSRAQRLADRAAAWLFWFALGAAVVTAIVWSIVGSPDTAVVRTITVLVIACPHALGLAIPLVVSIATERAARAGVLVKDRLSLESMRRVDTVLFDKTGTLTKGAPTVTDIASTEAWEADAVLALAAAAETDSEHPLARAIVRAASDRGLDVASATGFHSSPAVGVTAVVDGSEIRVGGPHLLDEVDGTEMADADAWRADGAIILHVVRDGEVIGGLALSDEIRAESHEAVDALHRRGVAVVMITGDAEAVAHAVAAELGIDRVFAGVRPEDKAAKVAELQHEGKKVAMVGDGVNDAPALAQAEVGIAIGAGTDVAIASAGVVLASDDPRSVVSVIELSQASYRKMKQNLWWAAGYNLLSVPLAAGVLAPIGFVLPMSVGAVLMSLSTIVVAVNAQTLRRLDLRPERLTQR